MDTSRNFFHVMLLAVFLMLYIFMSVIVKGLRLLTFVKWMCDDDDEWW